MNLSALSWIRNFLIATKVASYRRLFRMDIHPTVRMSLSARLDRSFPNGIHIGRDTYLAFDSTVLSHDYTRGLYLHTRIGNNCFVGGRSLIMPGVQIGDHCIIGAGSVVTRDVPSGSIAAGNPATVIRSGIRLGKFGRYLEADDTEERLRQIDPAVGALSSRERERRRGN